MREVSCRVFGILLSDLSRRHQPAEALVEGTGVSLALLRNKHERVTWDAYLRVMQNARKLWPTDEEFVNLGRDFWNHPLLRPLLLAARLLFTPTEFITWMNRGEGKGGQQLFMVIDATTRVLKEGVIEIELVTRAPHPPCREFFLITLGAMREFPRLLGHPRAAVELVENKASALYRIHLGQRSGALVRLRRALTFPFAARATATELNRAHEELVRRYGELEAARAALETHARHLKAAYALNATIRESSEMEPMLAAVAQALIEIEGVAGAEIVVDGNSGGASGGRRASAGGFDAGRAPLARTLMARGRTVGTLRIALAAQHASADAEAMADLLSPPIALAIGDSLALEELAHVRANLEAIVQSRTAELESTRDTLAATVVTLREATSKRLELIANVNHDVRTPIQVVSFAAGKLAQSSVDADRNLEKVRVNVQRILEMIDRLNP